MLINLLQLFNYKYVLWCSHRAEVAIWDWSWDLQKNCFEILRGCRQPDRRVYVNVKSQMNSITTWSSFRLVGELFIQKFLCVPPILEPQLYHYESTILMDNSSSCVWCYVAYLFLDKVSNVNILGECMAKKNQSPTKNYGATMQVAWNSCISICWPR